MKLPFPLCIKSYRRKYKSLVYIKHLHKAFMRRKHGHLKSLHVWMLMFFPYWCTPCPLRQPSHHYVSATPAVHEYPWENDPVLCRNRESHACISSLFSWRSEPRLIVCLLQVSRKQSSLYEQRRQRGFCLRVDLTNLKHPDECRSLSQQGVCLNQVWAAVTVQSWSFDIANSPAFNQKCCRLQGRLSSTEWRSEPTCSGWLW